MTGNIIVSLATIIFSLFFLIQSFALPSSRSAGVLGPSAWPSALLIIMLALSAWLLIKEVLAIRKHKQEAGSAAPGAKSQLAQDEEQGENDDIMGEIVYPHRYLAIFGITFVYLILLSFVGFLFATPLMIVAAMLVFGNRKLLPILSTSIIGSAVIVYIFILVLNIPLPRGTGFFRNLSVLLY